MEAIKKMEAISKTHEEQTNAINELKDFLKKGNQN
jgi:hypothetical protein